MTVYQTQCLDGGLDGEELLDVGEGLGDLVLLLGLLLHDGEGRVPAPRAGNLYF